MALPSRDPFASVNPFDDLIAPSSPSSATGTATSSYSNAPRFLGAANQQPPPAPLSGTTPSVLADFDPLQQGNYKLEGITGGSHDGVNSSGGFTHNAPTAPMRLTSLPPSQQKSELEQFGAGSSNLDSGNGNGDGMGGGRGFGLLESNSPSVLSRFNQLTAQLSYLKQKGLLTQEEHALLTHIMKKCKSLGGGVLSSGITMQQLEVAISRACSTGETASLATVLYQHQSSNANAPQQGQQGQHGQQNIEKQQQLQTDMFDTISTFDAFGIEDSFVTSSNSTNKTEGDEDHNKPNMNHTNDAAHDFGDFDIEGAFDDFARGNASAFGTPPENDDFRVSKSTPNRDTNSATGNDNVDPLTGHDFTSSDSDSESESMDGRDIFQHSSNPSHFASDGIEGELYAQRAALEAEGRTFGVRKGSSHFDRSGSSLGSVASTNNSPTNASATNSDNSLSDIYNLRGRIMHRVSTKMFFKKWICRFFLLSDRTLILCKDERAYNIARRKQKKKVSKSKSDSNEQIHYEEDAYSCSVMPHTEALHNAEARALGAEVIELHPYMKCTEVYEVKDNASKQSGMPSPWTSGKGINAGARPKQAWQFKIVTIFNNEIEQVCKLGHPSKQSCEELRSELLIKLDMHRSASNKQAASQPNRRQPFTGGRYSGNNGSQGSGGSYPPGNIFSPRQDSGIHGYKD